jgi:hypothetical protein
MSFKICLVISLVLFYIAIMYYFVKEDGATAALRKAVISTRIYPVSANIFYDGTFTLIHIDPFGWRAAIAVPNHVYVYLNTNLDMCNDNESSVLLQDPLQYACIVSFDDWIQTISLRSRLNFKRIPIPTEHSKTITDIINYLNISNNL